MAPAKTAAPPAKAAASSPRHEEERRPPTAAVSPLSPLNKLAGNRAVTGLVAQGGPALHVLRSNASEDAADAAARQVAAGAKANTAALSPVAPGAVQLSPMSRALEDDIKYSKTLEDCRQAVLYRLRRFGPAANDVDTSAVINRVFKNKPDDLWLAKTLQKHGAEPNWPAEELAKRRGKAKGQPAHFGTELGFVEGTVPGQTGIQRLPIEAFWFEGLTDERALIIGGVHGTERSGVEMARRVVNQLQSGTTKPHFTTIIVPELFPVNAARRKAKPTGQSNEARWVRTPEGKVRTSKPKSSATEEAAKPAKKGDETVYLDPNRTMPAKGASLETARQSGTALDAEGRPMPPETVILLELVARFKPSRVMSVHGNWNRSAGGFFGDPESKRADAPQTEKDKARELSLALALRASGASAADAKALAKDPKQIAKHKGLDKKAAEHRVAGNKLTGTPTGEYGGSSGGAIGTSFGTWGSTPVQEYETKDGKQVPRKSNRPAMTVITVEVPENHPSEDMPDKTKAQKEAKDKRAEELEAGATAIKDVFLGGP